LKPVSFDEEFQRALDFQTNGELAEAVETIRPLIAQAKDSQQKASTMLVCAIFLGQLGRTTEARATLQKARKTLRGVDDFDVRADLAEVWFDSADKLYDQAFERVEAIAIKYKGILGDPELRDVYEEVQWRRGMRLATLKRFSEALPFLEEATSSGNGDVYVQLGICYWEKGDLERAENALKEAIAKGLDDEWSLTAHYNLGRVYMRKAACARAIEAFSQAAKVAEKLGSPRKVIHEAMARCYSELGMSDKASQYAELSKKAK
jgi:tetratricopeptide (TPR) repeat protein